MVSERVLCKRGKLIPQCPPRDELTITKGAPEYYLLATASGENYKATVDCVLETGFGP